MKGQKELDSHTARQLMIAGRILGAMNRPDATPADIREMAKGLDVDALQAYVDSKPKDFIWGKECQMIIDLARSKN